MRINLIACINKVNALGKDNQLLYHIPEDLATFKAFTIGNIIIMGRNTYESLPKKPLPDRISVIISNDENYTPEVAEGETVYVCDSIESALLTIDTFRKDEAVFVIGGASLYRQFLEQNLIDTMYLTMVDDDAEGDVHFPEINDKEWNKSTFVPSSHHETKDGKVLDYQILIYDKA